MDRYELNSAALVSGPTPTDKWVPCEVLGKNSIGQLYVSPRHEGWSRAPFFVFPNFVRLAVDCK